MSKPSIVFSDFDGTLTDGEDLTPVFFDIVDLLKKNEVEFIPVSGRSLAWGHFLLTHFGFTHAIMEGGGVLTYKDSKGFIRNHYLVSADQLKNLDQFSIDLLMHFPGLELTADSLGRVTDRAIELPLLSSMGIKKEVEEYMEAKNINHSTSSVHVNFWCGEISKMKAVNHFLKHERKNMKTDKCLFFGDARNDQSCFVGFENSVGVSNIKPILDDLEHKPAIVLEGEENRGPLGVFNYLSSLL